MRKGVRAQERLAWRCLITGAWATSAPQGPLISGGMRRGGRAAVSALVKWGDGGLEGEGLGPASGDRTRPCAGSSGRGASEECVPSGQCSSSVLSPKAKGEGAVRKKETLRPVLRGEVSSTSAHGPSLGQPAPTLDSGPALALHPGALCERGTHVRPCCTWGNTTEAHSTGPWQRQDSEEATPRQQDVALDSDFPWNVPPSRASGPGTAPQTVVKHRGKGGPPRPRTGHPPVTRSPLTAASGPANISLTLPPGWGRALGGQC